MNQGNTSLGGMMGAYQNASARSYQSGRKTSITPTPAGYILDRKLSQDTGRNLSLYDNNGEYVLDVEQPKPCTPPKELFYDSGYRVESDPEMQKRLKERHRKTQDIMQSAHKSIHSIHSSDDEAVRKYSISALPDMDTS